MIGFKNKEKKHIYIFKTPKSFSPFLDLFLQGKPKIDLDRELNDRNPQAYFWRLAM